MPQIYTTAAPIRLGSSNAPGRTGRMAVIRRISPLLCGPAKVPRPNLERTLAFAAGTALHAPNETFSDEGEP